jgi:hypothetical protein
MLHQLLTSQPLEQQAPALFQPVVIEDGARAPASQGNVWAQFLTLPTGTTKSIAERYDFIVAQEQPSSEPALLTQPSNCRPQSFLLRNNGDAGFHVSGHVFSD